MHRAGREPGGGEPPYSSPACCGWSRGVEVTGGDTTAQKAATRTIVGSPEDAGSHATPNARQEAGHIPGTPPPLQGHPAWGVPWHWVAQEADEGTNEEGLAFLRVALGQSWAGALG